MAASTVSRATSFGHYLLPLTMNKCHIDAKQAEYHIEVKTRYLDLKKHRPERHALRNLLGMLHFRLDKYDESLAFFDKILSDGEDPDNLNALANRKYICDNLYRIPESRNCEEKLTELLPDDYQDEGEESRLRRARSLAEQAFAYSFDVFDESVTTERYRTSVELYDKALELAGDSLTQDEKEDWMISKGIACHKIFKEVKSKKALKNEAQKWFEKAANIFIYIKGTDDDILKSESLRHLGEIIQGKSNCSIQVPDNLRVSEPITYFKGALDSTPNDPKMLARYAKFLLNNHQLEEALEYVNKSIRLDDTVFNLLAFFLRGRIFLKDYKNKLSEFKTHKRSNRPDDALLINAQHDLEKLSASHSTPMYLQELAQVYYFIATECHGKVTEEHDRQKYLQQALTMCAKAAACQDGEKRSDVHKTRGKSLCSLGEHQHALRSFKRAVECEDSNNWLSNSGECLMFEYAHVLKGMAGGQPSSFQTLFADMVYWLHKAAKIYIKSPPHWSGSLNARSHLASNWEDFVEYCEKNNYMRELKDIEEASRDLRPSKQSRRDEKSHLSLMSPPQSANEEASGTRQVNFGEDHHQDAPIEAAKAPVYKPPHIRRHEQSVIEEATGKTEVNSEEEHPHANIEAAKSPTKPPKRRTQSVIEEASGTTTLTSEDYHPHIQVKSTSGAFSSTLELGGDETSEEKQIKLTVNLKTGIMQFDNLISSSQEWTSNDASNKPIRSAPEMALNPHLLNDFFVLHSSSASEWVFQCLLEELEGSNLKGCIKDRDFTIGKTKLANYTDSIANSACIVIVITEDFAQDDWCNNSMLMAIEQKKLLIPVKREETDLPMFLNTLTHLDATGAVDWKRLKRSIEQQIRLDNA